MMPAPKELISEVWRLKDREDDWKGLVAALENKCAASEEETLVLLDKIIGKYKETLGLL